MPSMTPSSAPTRMMLNSTTSTSHTMAMIQPWWLFSPKSASRPTRNMPSPPPMSENMTRSLPPSMSFTYHSPATVTTRPSTTKIT